MRAVKTFLLVFILSFLLNLVWEHLHSFLYAYYKNGPITEFILLRASVGDALFTLLFVTPFFYFEILKRNPWGILFFGFVLATLIEWYAHETNRWAYSELMPLVPFTPFGMTPLLQLGILGFLTYYVVRRYNS